MFSKKTLGGECWKSVSSPPLGSPLFLHGSLVGGECWESAGLPLFLHSRLAEHFSLVGHFSLTAHFLHVRGV